MCAAPLSQAGARAAQADPHAPAARQAPARVAGEADAVTWTGAMGVSDVHRKLYDE